MTAFDPDVTLARVAADRATVYAALSIGFYLPDEQLVWDLREGSFVSRVEAAVRWLGPDADAYDGCLEELRELSLGLRASPASDVLRDLRVEHARLFTGPGRPAVGTFESEYVDADDGGGGRLNGPSASLVAAWYRRAGLERAAGHNDLPDHVATELEFLYSMARRESAARLDGREEEARDLRRETDQFLREHPARWMRAFCRAVGAAHPHPFYGCLADLLAVHLATELGENLDRATLPWPPGPRAGSVAAEH